MRGTAARNGRARSSGRPPWGAARPCAAAPSPGPRRARRAPPSRAARARRRTGRRASHRARCGPGAGCRPSTPADTGHRALVAKDRVDPPGIVARTDDVGELVGQHLGAEAVERSRIVGLQHPPARLALGAELLHEHARTTVEAQPHHAVLGLRRLGRVLQVDPPALGQVDEQPQDGSAPAPANSKTRNLPRRPTSTSVAADECLGRGVVGLQTPRTGGRSRPRRPRRRGRRRAVRPRPAPQAAQARAHPTGRPMADPEAGRYRTYQHIQQ